MNQKTYAIFPSKRPKAERALPLEQRLAYSIQEAADLLGVAYTTLLAGRSAWRTSSNEDGRDLADFPQRTRAIPR